MKKMKVARKQFASTTFFRTAALCVCGVGVLGYSLSLTAGVVGYVPDRVLLKLKPDVSEIEAHTIIASQEAFEDQAIPGIAVRVLKVPASKLEKILDALSHNPNVEFAEPDAIIEPDFTPNDTYYGSQWHLPKIAAPAAWDKTLGSTSVIIAILDSGVDGTHPDLSAKMVAGWNTYNNNSSTADVFGHGTWVAGTAAASGNNGMGVASVALNCKLMPIRITDSSGYGYSSTMASGLTWAADHGARVANLSFAVTGISTVSSAASYFQSKGGVVTVAAGNASTTLTISDDPNVLTVSATTSTDAVASWSNIGTPIDLAAPGDYIYTTASGGGYQTVSGTSFAAPTVAGVAALVISANPKLSASQIQQVLKQSVDDLGTVGWDPHYGWGRVNAQKAVSLALSLAQTVTADTTAPTVSISSPASGATVSGTISLQASASDNVGVSSVTFSLDGAVLCTLGASPFSWSWNTAAALNGTHTLTATAKDAAGNVKTASISVNVSNYADKTIPTVAIITPGNGATVLRTVSVGVSTSDNVGVARVQLYVDGVLTSTSTTAPFTTTWNSRKSASGAHSLKAWAYDAAGNVGVSSVVTVYK
jgi:subtilisin family serine protease